MNRKLLPPPEWHAQEDYVAPDNKLEEAFVTIWQDVLSLEQVGVSDDFFELGGHSLLTLRLIKDIQIATGQQLTIADIFDNPTISELVTVIPTDAIITLPNETNKSLSSSASWLARFMSVFGTKKS